MKAKKELTKENIHEYVNVNQETGCWEWNRGKTSRGYGAFSCGKQTPLRSSHRLAWEIFNGPIPAGLFVCHKCDNPPCCNPDHLFLGTNSDNILDSMAKGRSKGPPPGYKTRGEDHHAHKITEGVVHAIRAAAATGFRGFEICKITGLPKSIVNRVISRKTWAHI
jgi:hypothetical protein